MKLASVQRFAQQVVRQVETVIVDKGDLLRTMFMAMLSNGHILMEDYPGLAKTLIARCFAQSLGCRFKRVQFTPDLLPSDITGTYILDREQNEFVLRKGPLFSNILLGDEINRSPPKTQAALLEGMEERQVTIEGDSYRLQPPFIVIATQNPIEYEGTYPLPEAQLDRFLIKVDVGYPSEKGEIEILSRRLSRKRDAATLKPLGSPKRFVACQRAMERVHVDRAILRYISLIVRNTRDHPSVEVGASPRGSLALLKLARSAAVLEGRDYVIPDDVKRFVVPALSHRLILKADPWVKGVPTASVINEVVSAVPVPKIR